MSKEMEEKKTYTVGEICKMLDISPITGSNPS